MFLLEINMINNNNKKNKLGDMIKQKNKQRNEN